MPRAAVGKPQTPGVRGLPSDEVATPKRERREVALTAEVGRAIVGAIEVGNFPSVAARPAGISYGTLKQWLKRAKEGEQPFADFAVRYRAAECKAEATLVEAWKDAAPGDWRAAKEFLARRYPERWSEQASMDGAGALAAAGFQININIDSKDRGGECKAHHSHGVHCIRAQAAIDVTPPVKDPDSSLN